MKEETKQQRYRRKLIEAGLKRLEIYIHKDDGAAEKAVKAYDRKSEMKK